MRAEKRMSHLVTRKQVQSLLGWNQGVEAAGEMEEERKTAMLKIWWQKQQEKSSRRS